MNRDTPTPSFSPKRPGATTMPNTTPVPETTPMPGTIPVPTATTMPGTIPLPTKKHLLLMADRCAFSDAARETAETVFAALFDGQNTAARLWECLWREKHRETDGFFFYDETLVPTAFFREAAALGKAFPLVAPPVFLRIVYAILAEYLHRVYRALSIDDGLFFDSARVMLEGLAASDTPPAGFDARFCVKILGGEAIRIGSFLFQPCRSPYPQFAALLPPGTPILRLHVPKGASLAASERLSSYREATAFFRKRLSPAVPLSALLPFVLDSWLLSPEHAFLGDSPIHALRSDFFLLASSPDETHTGGALYHLFGTDEKAAILRLPKASLTRLQRFYYEKLLADAPFQTAVGVRFPEE